MLTISVRRVSLGSDLRAIFGGMEAKSNFECPGCGAKLPVMRVRVLLRPHERATCPNCKARLSARDGEVSRPEGS
jgi:hypothetical protein